MATVNAADAYDFSMFESNTARQTAAVPASEPGYGYTGEQPFVVLSEKHRQQLESMRSLEATKRAFLFCCAIVMLFACIVGQISCSAVRDEVVKEIESVKSDIAIQKSEKVKLTSEMEKMFSVSNVEDYAVNVLGMVKLEDYQIRYVDLSGSDTILYSGAETGEESNGFLSEIKEYFTDLFS